ncbi:MAG: acetylxylan esterase [Verrucomicrobiales bacterium]|jgi:cephalosporin-C deacetylase|nr:acetylxylan esterase [Verrucomicrobiales bacterium]
MNHHHLLSAALTLTALLAAQPIALTMESNLATPYAPKPSPPAKAELAFYSKQTDDMLFDGSADPVIHVRAGLRCVGLKYEVRRNCFAAPFITGSAEALPANTFIISVPAAKLPFAGFYDITVELDAGDGQPPVKSTCTFGWRADQMKIKDNRPADFDEFWAKGLAELKKIPLNATVGEFQTFTGKEIDDYNVKSAAIPGDYDPTGHQTETVESAKVAFDSAGGLRVHGWLAKPPGTGPFPAMLILPGAGFNARPRPLEHARHGYLALDIQVHGQEVDLEKYPTIPGYYDQAVFNPPADNYMRRIYLNCLQAVSYLASRPDVDPRRIVVVGGSQGGRTTVSTAALDPRVAAAVPAITHHANVPYVSWAWASQKTKQDGMDSELPPTVDNDEQRCLAYYDTMNFAPTVKCPVFMNAGLIDGVSPPSGVFAVYQRLGTKDKTMVPLPGLAHDWSAEFDRRAWRWLEEKLKNR